MKIECNMRSIYKRARVTIQYEGRRRDGGDRGKVTEVRGSRGDEGTEGRIRMGRVRIERGGGERTKAIGEDEGYWRGQRVGMGRCVGQGVKGGAVGCTSQGQRYI